MKRKVEAASSPSMLEPILMKTHPQKKLLKRARNEDDDDQKDKLDPLPTDLEVEILTRLPAKSLMKLLCVSKIWFSIIRSQRFVDSFYALSSTRSRFTVAFSNGIFGPAATRRLFIFSSSLEEEDLSSSPSSLVAKLDMKIPSVSRTYPYRCPSIHGFVGCANTSKFIVCNPSTKQVITLPIKGVRASLGYDPVGRQFKVLNLVTGPDEFRSYLVHEFITIKARGQVSRNQVTTANYVPVTDGVYINGSLYSAAWSPKLRMDPVVVCVDVRYETISLIKAPRDVVYWETESVLINYRGKLASISLDPSYVQFRSFGLWILEDAVTHEWSKQTFELPFPLVNVTSSGTNKAGEIIFAPNYLPRIGTPFFIFYYNVEKKDMRRVRIHGIADNEEFRRQYGLVDFTGVTISPEHIESIASL